MRSESSRTVRLEILPLVRSGRSLTASRVKVVVAGVTPPLPSRTLKVRVKDPLRFSTGENSKLPSASFVMVPPVATRLSTVRRSPAVGLVVRSISL